MQKEFYDPHDQKYKLAPVVEGLFSGSIENGYDSRRTDGQKEKEKVTGQTSEVTSGCGVHNEGGALG